MDDLDALLTEPEGPDDSAEADADASKQLEALTVLAPITVRAAADLFLARAYPPTDRPMAVFPWPGGDTAERGSHARPLRDGALLPPPGGYAPKGWPRMHSKIGPMHADEMTVLVAPTKAGKTGWALSAAEASARAGAPVLYLSAELGPHELVARLLAMRASGSDDDGGGISWSAVLHGRAPEADARAACDALCADCPDLFLWAPRMAERGAAEIGDMVRRVVLATGRAPLVVIDYLQRLAPGATLREEVRALSGTLRDLSRPGSEGADWPGCSTLILSSTARTNYEKLGSVGALNVARNAGEPLEGLGKESGEIETDASRVFVLATDGDVDGAGARDALVVLAVSRTGGEGAYPFRFYGACGRWVEPTDADARRIREKKPPATDHRPSGTRPIDTRGRGGRSKAQK